MKKILTIIFSVLLCVGAVGGSFAFAKHLDGEKNVEQPEQSQDSSPTDDSVKDSQTETVGAWQICTDVSQLEVGDKIIIVAKTGDFALGTTQNTSNRSVASIEKSDNTATVTDDVQVITLENGIHENTFAFYVGTGYLYAPSSSSNHLKTRADINENASWSIEIDSSNIANIVAQGESSRNVLMYNSGNEIFSCYASSQEAVVIYKWVDGANN
ncbi:MAG: hypothetical protein IJX88_05105 [Clostridia bacterium]|nr:hypothetical protein [Clostridia bacterium]